MGLGGPLGRIAHAQMRQENPGASAIVRVAGEAAAEMLPGFIVLSQFAVKNAQAVKCVGVIRIVRQGLREAGAGLVRLAERFPHIAEIVVGVDMIGPHRLEHNPQIVMKFRHRAASCDRLADQIGGCRKPASAVGLDTRFMQGDRIGSRRRDVSSLALFLTLGAALFAVH